MEVDDIGAIGAFGMPMRFNVAEGTHVVWLTGSPYKFNHYKARTRSVYVNRNMIGMYRGVGFPLACVLAELLTDAAADAAGIDTVEFKRRNYWSNPRYRASHLAANSWTPSPSMNVSKSSSA